MMQIPVQMIFIFDVIMFGNSNDGDTDKRLFRMLHTNHKWHGSDTLVSLRCHQFLPTVVCRIGRTACAAASFMRHADCFMWFRLFGDELRRRTDFTQTTLLDNTAWRHCEAVSCSAGWCITAFRVARLGCSWSLSLHTIVEYDLHSAISDNYRKCEVQSLLMTLTCR
jgi:hypothetical protein